MSTQLAHRLDELSQERARLRESIRRIGETFASNLDRPALLELALKTAVDAVQGSCGRLSSTTLGRRAASRDGERGIVRGAAVRGLAAEREAEMEGAGVCQREFGDNAKDHVSVLAASLGPPDPEGRPHGVITVARRGRPFTDDDRELLRSLARRRRSRSRTSSSTSQVQPAGGHRRAHRARQPRPLPGAARRRGRAGPPLSATRSG